MTTYTTSRNLHFSLACETKKRPTYSVCDRQTDDRQTHPMHNVNEADGNSTKMRGPHKTILNRTMVHKA